MKCYGCDEDTDLVFAYYNAVLQTQELIVDQATQTMVDACKNYGDAMTAGAELYRTMAIGYTIAANRLARTQMGFCEKCAKKYSYLKAK